MSLKRSRLARLPTWAFAIICLAAAFAGACLALLLSLIACIIAGVNGSDPVAAWSVLPATLAGLVLPIIYLRRKRRYVPGSELHDQAPPTRQEFSDFKLPSVYSAKTDWGEIAQASSVERLRPAIASDQASLHVKSRRFSLNPGERPYMEGYATYIQNAAWLYHGDVYLTSDRLAYCKKNPIIFYLLAGPIFGHLFKGKQILFEIPLVNLASIVKQKHGFGSKFVLGTSDGKEYGVQFATRQERWISAIKDAAERARPGLKTDAIGESLYFVDGAVEYTGERATSPHAQNSKAAHLSPPEQKSLAVPRDDHDQTHEPPEMKSLLEHQAALKAGEEDRQGSSQAQIQQPISNLWAWIIAFTPLVLLAFEISARSGWNLQLLAIAGVLGFLGWLDIRAIKQAGFTKFSYGAILGAIAMTPIYLFVRAYRCRQHPYYGFAWIICFLVAILGLPDTNSLLMSSNLDCASTQVQNLVLKIAKEQMDKLAIIGFPTNLAQYSLSTIRLTERNETGVVTCAANLRQSFTEETARQITKETGNPFPRTNLIPIEYTVELTADGEIYVTLNGG